MAQTQVTCDAVTLRQQQLRNHTRSFNVALQLTKEREVDEREVVEQQEPEEFACMQHMPSATAACTKWLCFR